jgi:hypothetical protein
MNFLVPKVRNVIVIKFWSLSYLTPVIDIFVRSNKNEYTAGHHWFSFIILAAFESETGKIWFEASPGK